MFAQWPWLRWVSQSTGSVGHPAVLCRSRCVGIVAPRWHQQVPRHALQRRGGCLPLSDAWPLASFRRSVATWQRHRAHAIIRSMCAESIATGPPDQDHVTGLVERVTFHSPETGFGVLQVKVRGHRDLVTVVGTLPERDGRRMARRRRGAGPSDKQYGQQFKAETSAPCRPARVEGIEKYLGSGHDQGHRPGPGRPARQGLRRAGVFESSTPTPHRLIEVDGIGAGPQEKIRRPGTSRRPSARSWCSCTATA